MKSNFVLRGSCVIGTTSDCRVGVLLNPCAAAWQLVLCVGRFRIGLFFIYLAVSKDPMVLNRASACVCVCANVIEATLFRTVYTAGRVTSKTSNTGELRELHLSSAAYKYPFAL